MITTTRVAAEVPYLRAVTAEFARAAHSASARFALAGLCLAAVQGLGWWIVASRQLSTWDQLLAWQALYVTALLAPLTALLVALTVTRERRAREGGTLWRPLSPATGFAARGTVLALQLVAFNAALTLPMLALGQAHGLRHTPVARLCALWVTCSASALLPASLAVVLAPVVGRYVTVGLALVWQVGGTLAAESAAWLWMPWTWSVRAALPVLGIHSNGVALEPASPILSWNPAIPAGLSLLAAATVLAAGAAACSLTHPGSGRRRARQRFTTQAVPAAGTRAPEGAEPDRTTMMPTRRRLLAALSASLRGTGVLTLTLGSVLLLGTTACVWDAGHVRALATWLLIPFGTCLLACLAWGVQRDAWRAVALRRTTARLGAGLLALCLATLTLVVAIAAVADSAAGGAGTARFTLVLWTVGLAWLATCLWLATRFGAGAAIGVTLVVLTLSVVCSSDAFRGRPLWLIGLLGWPDTADNPLRTGTVTLLSVTLTACALGLWAPALRAAAGRS